MYICNQGTAQIAIAGREEHAYFLGRCPISLQAQICLYGPYKGLQSIQTGTKLFKDESERKIVPNRLNEPLWNPVCSESIDTTA